WEYAEALILPLFLRRLTHAAPGMSITTSQVKRRDLETELASGSVDLAIDIPLTMSDRIRHKWLLNDPFVVIARHGHPAIADKLDLNTYLGQRHIQVSSRRHGPSLIDIELSRAGASPASVSAQPAQLPGLRGSKYHRHASDLAGAPCATAEHEFDEPGTRCFPFRCKRPVSKPICTGTRVWRMIRQPLATGRNRKSLGPGTPSARQRRARPVASGAGADVDEDQP